MNGVVIIKWVLIAGITGHAGSDLGEEEIIRYEDVYARECDG